MIEEEAKTKWCPFARDSGADYSSPSFNRVNGAAGGGSKCLASSCMAWRKTGGAWVSRTHTPEQVAAALKPEDVNAVWSLEGYCGLAGRE